ncbi:flagellar biosynthesis protein FlgG [Azospirillum sp. TSH7]|uniref:flagellar basal-body rod protein FlgF n=1 Tax=unclassified Azospirillum TaxID=2630922 RepID=UPI000D61EB41|nr:MULTISPECIES: flagellar basal-body rod protein FlgF [unclassified Azospirillum]PWC57322.1 flagellar biosynthesis protein FlgG [Azospirillum sp. TSH7]PWC61097.1 flagellar biosynthesis protein FlgG [Azospirillum sp. TSH20]QCG93844.1 flagellar basal-body rod protein FlgF [Azospirillum sp. TSA2s]
MENQLYIGLSRQMALRRQLDVVANNVANMNTVGFRGERTLFEAAMEAGGRKPTDRIAFTIDRSTYIDLRAGAFTETGNPYDVALDGDGFLSVQTPNGVRYSRDGRLRRDADGTLVGPNGYPVLDDGRRPIAIPSDSSTITIGSDGLLSADGNVIARIAVSRFDNPQALKQTGDLLFEPADGMEARPAPDTRLVEGKVERSNVQGIVEIGRMMDLTRDYQAVTKMVDDGQDLLRSAINRLGKSS